MTAAALAATYAAAFSQTRAWSVAEFEALLQASSTVFEGDAQCFVLGRIIADEAEILTLATAPQYQRSGLGQSCLKTWEKSASARGATQVFLEVSAENTAANGLYIKAGYAQAGRRKNYYAQADGRKIDALILRKPL